MSVLGLFSQQLQSMEGRTSGQLAETAALHEQALNTGDSSGSIICIRTCQQGPDLGLGKNWVSEVERYLEQESVLPASTWNLRV